jgi:hypothetical protein
VVIARHTATKPSGGLTQIPKGIPIASFQTIPTTNKIKPTIANFPEICKLLPSFTYIPSFRVYNAFMLRGI